MAHKILLITGSPRKKGNTSLLADAFTEGALQAGNEVHRFDVGAANIKGCSACKHCFTHEGKCSINDDMQALYPYFYECDVLVFAAPIYFFTFNAQIKACIDRMYCCAGKPFAVKSTALLITQGGKNPSVADPAITAYQAISSYIGWEDRGVIVASDVTAKGDIEGRPQLDEARALGASIQ